MAFFKPCLIKKEKLNDYPIRDGQYIVCPDTGEIYVDISDSTRRKCASKIKSISIDGSPLEIDMNGNIDIKAPVWHNNTEFWQSQSTLIPRKGQIVIFEDAQMLNSTILANVKIGDGVTNVMDLPFLTDSLFTAFENHINNTDIHITAAERAFWNNKISGAVDGEVAKFSKN